MILGVEKLLKLVAERKLVEALSQRELTNPEGAGFDFRVGKVYEVGKNGGFLGINKRKTADLSLIAEYEENKIKQITIKPGMYYVVTTVEKVNLPDNILTLCVPRSTLYRSGVTVYSGNGMPGYHGEFSVGMVNVGGVDFTMEMGARFMHVIFYEIKGKTNVYRGQWQGGRTSTDQLETQF